MPRSDFASTISTSAVSARMKYHSLNMLRNAASSNCSRGQQAAAETEPAGKHVPALRPGENPRDGAQVLDARIARRDDGREPMRMRSIRSIGVALRK